MSESLHRRGGSPHTWDEISLHLLQVQFTLPGGGPAYWRPAVNAFGYRDRFIICVDLAGMNKDAIDVTVKGRWLTLRGTRPSLEPGVIGAGLVALAMEIDHGPFERVLELPADIDAQRVKAEYREGVLWIDLPLATQG